MGREREELQAAGGEPDAVRYADAVLEIERLLASIDRDEVDVDELGQKVERAVALLKVCRAKLKATEARVVEVLKDLDEDDAAADAATPGPDDGEGAEEDAAPRKRKRKKGAAPVGEGAPELPPAGGGGGGGGGDGGGDEELPF